jgi:hypothetical protein
MVSVAMSLAFVFQAARRRKILERPGHKLGGLTRPPVGVTGPDPTESTINPRSPFRRETIFDYPA